MTASILYLGSFHTLWVKLTWLGQDFGNQDIKSGHFMGKR